MKVLPASKDPQYFQNELDFDLDERHSLSDGISFDSLQYIRSLPTSAGDILLWSGKTLHFGGVIWPSKESALDVPGLRNFKYRRSFSFAFSTAKFESPTLRLQQSSEEIQRYIHFSVEFSSCRKVFIHSGKLPSLFDRIRVIASQLWTYAHYESHPNWVYDLLEEVERDCQ